MEPKKYLHEIMSGKHEQVYAYKCVFYKHYKSCRECVLGIRLNIVNTPRHPGFDPRYTCHLKATVEKLKGKSGIAPVLEKIGRVKFSTSISEWVLKITEFQTKLEGELS